MESDSQGAIGGLAANRPLLILVLFGFGLAALAAAGFLRAPETAASGMRLLDFSISLAIALAVPHALAALAPRRGVGRWATAAAIAAAFIVAFALLAGAPPLQLGGVSLHAASFLAGAALFGLMIAGRPLIGGLAGFGLAGPVAAIIGAVSAAALLSLEDVSAPHVIGAVATMSASFAALVSVGVAADFANAFARGGDSHFAAGVAAHRAAAPAFNAALNVLCVFAAGLLPAAEMLDWSWRMIFFAAGGGVVAASTALFFSAATLSLGVVTEEAASIENHRRQRFRRWWRPVRDLLPTSSALAFVAILMILAIVAQFETYQPISLIKVGLIVGCAAAAALTYVSLRTGLFVMAALFFAMVLADWGYVLFGVAAPALTAQLTALACLAALFAQVAASWRDARSPRRKAREATEAAMIDGAYRYVASAAFAIAAFAAAAMSGLWSDAGAAGAYYALLASMGAVFAAPLMTAIGAMFGRD
ncbi:MAG: hypothetical protein AAGJ87_10910 [Pseudomonadota bacterium]